MSSITLAVWDTTGKPVRTGSLIITWGQVPPKLPFWRWIGGPDGNISGNWRWLFVPGSPGPPATSGQFIIELFHQGVTPPATPYATVMGSWARLQNGSAPKPPWFSLTGKYATGDVMTSSLARFKWWAVKW